MWELQSLEKNVLSKRRADNTVENIIFVNNMYELNLTPAIIAMFLFILITYSAPQIFKKPTNFKPLDDLVKMSIVQKQYMMTGTILMGVIILATNYIIEEFLKGQKLF